MSGVDAASADELIQDEILSELHSDSPAGTLFTDFYVSFRAPLILFDVEGDVDVPRRRHKIPKAELDSAVAPSVGDSLSCMRIRHASTTSLADCGLQVWRGALLMCDWLIHISLLRRDIAADEYVVRPWFCCIEEQRLWLSNSLVGFEIGAGVGVCAFVANETSLFERYFATDYNQSILQAAHRNLEPCQSDCVSLRALDLKSDNSYLCSALHAPLEKSLSPSTVSDSEYSWSSNDLMCLNQVRVLVGADVIFDDELTISLVHFLLEFFRRDDCVKVPFRVAYFSIEKRTVFSLAHRSPVAPAIECFLTELRAHGLQASLIDGIPQFVEYDRGRELIMMRVIDRFE
jgi:hypothetical protein